MRVFRQTVILFLLLVLVAGVYFLLLEPKKEKEKIQREKEKKLTDFESSLVQEIWITKSDGEKIGFRRRGKSEWDIIHPVWAEADRFSVNPIASRYSGIEIERLIEENPDDLSQYGLSPPKFRVEIKLKDSPYPLTFLVGGRSQVGYSVYMMKDGDKKVYLVSAALESVIDKSLEEFRQKRPMDFIVPDVRRFIIKMRGKEYLFKKEKGDWWIKFPDTPTFVKASDSRVRDLLYSITGIKVKEFVSDVSPPARMYGLDTPEMLIQVFVEEEGEERVYELALTPRGRDIFAKRPSRPNIFKIDVKKDFYAAPLKTSEYRERKVIHFYVWRVREIAVERKDSAVIIQRDPVNTEKWYIVSGERKTELEPSEVKEALRQLANTKVVEFVEDNADVTKWIDIPEVRVKIDVEGRDKPYYLILGGRKKVKGKEGIIGALEDQKSVYLFPDNITNIIARIENIPIKEKKEGEK